MTGRLAPMLLALALAATACAGQEITAEPGEIDENTFVTHVADFEGDVGQGLSLTTDADGNPHMAYLAFEDPETTGATPQPAVPGAPELPAVKHAHLVGGAWTRSFVAEGVGVEPGDETAIAVDPNGVHHIIWTEGGSLVYSNNAEGAFSEPETIAEGEVFGPSIAVTSSGAPMVAFYQSGLAEPDVDIPIVRAALGTEGGWAPETVAEASLGEPATTAIGESGVEAVVAYSSEGRTFLARRAEAWASEEADADGGLGVSMAIDGDGNPHLAYYNASGQVRHAHSIDGGAWETTPVGDRADLESRSSIAVDSEGVHHIAWQTAEGVVYATNADGSFVEQEVPAEASSGVAPRVAAGTEGVVYLAWYDAEDTEVQLAVRGGGEPLLAVPQPGPGAQPTTEPTTQPTGPPPCEPSGTELSIAAQGLAFNQECLAAPVGEAFTIQFDNQEAVPHNVAIYGGPPPSDALFQGETFPGPESRTYQVDALDAGQLYFQCDVHPTTMNGTFVVA